MATKRFDKYIVGSGLLGILFLLAAVVIGVTVVTDKNITLNPGKKAGGIYLTPSPTGVCNRKGYDFLCSARDYSEKECLDIAVRHYGISKGVIVIPNCCYTIVISGSENHYCYVLPTSSTPTPTLTPSPTGACNQQGLLYTCPFKSSSEKECMAEAINHFEGLYYNVVPNCCSLVDCRGGNDNCFTCYVTRIYPSPTPSIKVVKITSGSCAQKCVSMSGTCLSVGIDSEGTSGEVFTWGNYSSCQKRKGLCNSTLTKLPSGGKTCSGTLPEWTNCRCQINPYVN